jgi:predicted enzyme related to lactoylglutathione lyase
MSGRIGWIDLTVSDAEGVRDFYARVAGWQFQPVEMDGYSDYVMTAEEDVVGGVCHAQGPNAALPPAWILYIAVDDLDASLAEATALGGSVIAESDADSEHRYVVLRDPGGAAFALMQAPQSDGAG